MPTTLLLFVSATLNAMHLFTQTRTYRLHMRTRTNPVSSPHTKFVESPRRDPSPSRDAKTRGRVSAPSTFTTRIVGLLGWIFRVAWQVLVGVMRFLFGWSTTSASMPTPPRGMPAEEIQQLEVWTPGELERTLLTVYSPGHALLWVCMDSTNWVVLCLAMGVMGVQLGTLVRGYERLVKDRQILAAEVMGEYNEGVSGSFGRRVLADGDQFVYPRLMPVRRDAAVMTHQAEMVGWED